MKAPADPVYPICHGAVDSTVSDRQGSRRDTFFGYVHKRLPNGARIGRLGFPEQALVHQCLDNPIRHLGAGQDEAAALALTAPALALLVGHGGVVGHGSGRLVLVVGRARFLQGLGQGRRESLRGSVGNHSIVAMATWPFRGRGAVMVTLRLPTRQVRTSAAASAGMEKSPLYVKIR